MNILLILFYVLVDFIIFFFFQAEDGIRDATVTGVQTCALPICGDAADDLSGRERRLRHPPITRGTRNRPASASGAAASTASRGRLSCGRSSRNVPAAAAW